MEMAESAEAADLLKVAREMHFSNEEVNQHISTFWVI